MQKRHFLKKTLLIFFISTTVAAIQPRVVHAQIPGQAFVMRFGHRAFNHMCRACLREVFIQGLQGVWNGNFEPLWHVLIENPRSLLRLSIVAAGRETFELPALHHFTRNNRLGYFDSQGHQFDPVSLAIFIAHYVYKLKQDIAYANRGP